MGTKKLGTNPWWAQILTLNVWLDQLRRFGLFLPVDGGKSHNSLPGSRNSPYVLRTVVGYMKAVVIGGWELGVGSYLLLFSMSFCDHISRSCKVD